MKEKSIRFLLVHVHEAHSSAWPAGLPDQTEPQKCYKDRIDRAEKFVQTSCSLIDVNDSNSPIIIRIDGWDNCFEQKFRAWPDKYYLIDSAYKVLARSEYGMFADALIDVDSLDLLKEILNKV
jgi:hypothetical protein